MVSPLTRRVEGQDPNHPVILAIRWILENRSDPSGEQFNQSSLARAAGLTRKHVGQILQEYQSADIERRTAIALAKAGRVRLEWLLTGEGPRDLDPDAPTQPEQPPPPFYPEREKAAKMAGMADLHEEAVRRVVAYSYPDTVDPTKLRSMDWYDRMRAEHDEIEETRCAFPSGSSCSASPAPQAEPIKRIA